MTGVQTFALPICTDFRRYGFAPHIDECKRVRLRTRSQSFAVVPEFLARIRWFAARNPGAAVARTSVHGAARTHCAAACASCAALGRGACGLCHALQHVRHCADPVRSEEHTSELQSLMRTSY